MKKQILVNLMLFGAGGGETHLLHFAKALTKRGVEITLVSRYARPSTPIVQQRGEIPLRFITTPFGRNRRLYRLSTLWALLVWPFLLRKKFDLLYTWELSPFTKFLNRFLRPGGKVFLQRIGEPYSPNSSFDPELEKLLDGLIVETKIHTDSARKILKKQIPILSLPLLGHCVATPDRNGRRPGEVFQVTFLGRYHGAKGIFRLVEIWPTLNIGNANLTFYGWGPELERLQEVVSTQGLEKSIRLKGPYAGIDELGKILDQTDLVVLPSETEGLPVVLLEAMAHGVPFVATDVGATRTLAEDNPDVRVVPVDNQAIAAAINETVRRIRSGDIRGDRLQAYFRKRYDYDVLAKRWVESFLDPSQSWESERSQTTFGC